MSPEEMVRALTALSSPDVSTAYAYQLSRTEGEDNAGWIALDNRLANGSSKSRKHLVIYSSCHGSQMSVCLRDIYKDITERFYVHILFSHRLNLFKVPSTEPVLKGLFGSASVVFWNELAPNFGEQSTIHFRKYCEPDCKIVNFVPPSCACWWPICPTFGEQGVRSYVKAGLSYDDVVHLFLAGRFDPRFSERFEDQMANIAHRERTRDVGLSQFCSTNYKKIKLFFTFNHCTFHTIDYITGRCLEEAGLLDKYDPDHSLEVDVNHCRWGDHFPETNYEFDYFKFDYPLRWPNDRGGTDFYLKEIKRICGAPPPVINPDDDP